MGVIARRRLVQWFVRSGVGYAWKIAATKAARVRVLKTLALRAQRLAILD